MCYRTVANEPAETGQTPNAVFQQATQPQKSDAIIPAEPACCPCFAGANGLANPSKFPGAGCRLEEAPRPQTE